MYTTGGSAPCNLRCRCQRLAALKELLIKKYLFIKNRLIDKFYEGDYKNENAQVPENNNSSDKESNKEIFDFVSGEDICDDWLP